MPASAIGTPTLLRQALSRWRINSCSTLVAFGEGGVGHADLLCDRGFLLFSHLISTNPESHEYADFTLFAWDALLDDVEPMIDDLFWPHVEAVGWPNGSDDISGLSKLLATRLSLVDAASLSLAALDWAGELEFLWENPGVNVEGEDSQEDFLYHLVGLGRSLVQSLSTNAEPAVAIANDYSYVESFKYVLDGCRCYFQLCDYVDAFFANKRFARSNSEPIPNTMRKVDEKTPGLVIRVDVTSYEIVTPIDSRTIVYP